MSIVASYVPVVQLPIVQICAPLCLSCPIILYFLLQALRLQGTVDRLDKGVNNTVALTKCGDKFNRYPLYVLPLLY